MSSSVQSTLDLQNVVQVYRFYKRLDSTAASCQRLPPLLPVADGAGRSSGRTGRRGAHFPWREEMFLINVGLNGMVSSPNDMI